MHTQSVRILTTAFAVSVFSLAAATSAQAQNDHLQCHKVKDTQKFKAAVVALTAVQAEFQMPDNCTIKGKGAEFCVPVEKAVIESDAPGSFIGAGQDLSNNDYVCYKMKCPKTTHADTLVTDQFGERVVEKIKAPKRICVPAVKGAVTTTTTTTTTLPPMCSVAGVPDACYAYVATGACASCCGLDFDCLNLCANAQALSCSDEVFNTQCASAVNDAGCAAECCPN